MQAVDLDIKASITRQIKKNPQQLLTAMEAIVKDAGTFHQIKPALEQIESLWSEESKADTTRKSLSRKIGQLKKSNLDTGEVIEQVSSLSQQIKSLQSQRKLMVDEIVSTVQHRAQPVAAPKPLHFTITDTALTGNRQAQLNVATAADFTKWQAYVQNCAHSTVYHDAKWLTLIEHIFSQKTYPLQCTNSNGEIQGVMALVHMKSRVFGSFTISTPYFNYGGPLASSAEAAECLMQHAADLTRQLGCSHMEVRETHQRDNWACSDRKVSMILSLPATDSALDSMLGSKLRAQVNRAANHGLSATTGGIELLDDFYRVYSQNMRDLGTPAYERRFFEEILHTFPDKALITTVHQSSKALAAGFLLGHKDKLEIPWASSLRKYNSTGANMLLYRSILSEAIARQYAYFDFGRSTKDASTYRFKKQWGAEEYPLYWHYWTADNEIPQINPDNPKYKAVISVWKRLPVAVTRIVGPVIAKNLP